MKSRSPEPTSDTMNTGFQPRKLLKDQAYESLKMLILSGEIPPDSFLSERQLSAHLTMSKTPIRAALERLDLEGFVVVSPQQGILVRDISLREINEVFDLRIALEPFVVRQLAGRLSEPDIQQLNENRIDQQNAADSHDMMAYIRLDAAYHMLLCEFLDNREITRVMRCLRDKLHRVVLRVLQMQQERMTSSTSEHRNINEAIVRGDGNLAARLIVEHLEYGKALLISTPR